jgi:hypothetical protein
VDWGAGVTRLPGFIVLRDNPLSHLRDSLA